MVASPLPLLLLSLLILLLCHWLRHACCYETKHIICPSLSWIISPSLPSSFSSFILSFFAPFLLAFSLHSHLYFRKKKKLAWWSGEDDRVEPIQGRFRSSVAYWGQRSGKVKILVHTGYTRKWDWGYAGYWPSKVHIELKEAGIVPVLGE